VIEVLTSYDQELFLIMNSWHSLWLNPVMVFFSSQLIWLPFVLILLFFAFKELDRKSFYLFLLFLFLTIIATDITSSYLLKNIFERMRPCRLTELKPLINNFGQRCGGKFGFVSSHAANSCAILAFSFGVLKFKSPKFYLIWLLPLIVSFSRIYLGVHYPGDVLGGIVVGVSWGMILAMFYKNHKSWGEPA